MASESDEDHGPSWESAYQSTVQEDSEPKKESFWNSKFGRLFVGEEIERALPWTILDKRLIVGTILLYFVWDHGSNRYLRENHFSFYLDNFPFGLVAFALNCSSVFVAGAGLVAPYFLYRSWKTTGRIFVNPGDWLLLIFGLRAFRHLPYRILELTKSKNRDWYLENAEFWLEIIQSFSLSIDAILTILALFAVVRCRGFWRIPFIFLVVPHGVVMSLARYQFIESKTIYSVFSAYWLIPGFFLLLAIDVDRSKKKKRDWLHWMGVYFGLATLVVLSALRLIIIQGDPF